MIAGRLARGMGSRFPRYGRFYVGMRALHNAANRSREPSSGSGRLGRLASNVRSPNHLGERPAVSRAGGDYHWQHENPVGMRWSRRPAGPLGWEPKANELWQIPSGKDRMPRHRPRHPEARRMHAQGSAILNTLTRQPWPGRLRALHGSAKPNPDRGRDHKGASGYGNKS